jgi:Ca-activated chloride channel family protein
MRHISAAAVLLLLLTLTACGGGGGYGEGGDRRAGDQPAGPVFRDYGVNAEVATAEENRSTFALDVDTGSYAITRAYLTDGVLPDPASVRTEEFVNSFPQDYPPPPHGIGIHLDGTPAPFLDHPDKRILRVGLQGAVVDPHARPAANVTLIVDTSGSMAGTNLELVRAGLGRLVDSLRPDDAVALVTFSTRARLLLPMTPMTRPGAIRAGIDALEPQQSTNLEAGLRIGYQHALANLREGGLNRVVLLSDGVANVGQTDPERLAHQIAQEAGTATQLAVIGVGRQTYDEVILERFANNGNGFYAYVDTVTEAERLFVHDLVGTLQAVALDAKVQVSFDRRAVSHFRLLGYENRLLGHDDLRDDTVDGGEVGAGHTVTALYEVTLSGSATRRGDAALATVQVRWRDPRDGAPMQRSTTLTSADLYPSFERAPVRLRQDIVVAAFAELLRGAPRSWQVSHAQLVTEADGLRRTLPDDGAIAELARLTSVAAELAG